MSEREPFPAVEGRCPACGQRGLFLGAGGYVTCSNLDCREPDAASAVLDDPRTKRMRDAMRHE